VTANPAGAWVAQQAGNLLLVLGQRSVRFVLRDWDAKACRPFDDVFRSEDAEVVLTPVQAPNANAYAERWIGTVRAECLDWLLIIGRGHLEQVLRIYTQHYHQHRPHHALRLEAPDRPSDLTVVGRDHRAQVHRRSLLGGLLHEYRRTHERISVPHGRRSGWPPGSCSPVMRSTSRLFRQRPGDWR
jgi:putative transposase